MICLGLVATHLQMTLTPMLREDRSSLERHLDGTAERPFCYRVLTPFAGLAVGALIPHALGDRICAPTRGWRACDFMPKRADLRAPYLGIALIELLSVIAYAVVLGRGYRRLFDASEAAEWAVAAGSLLVLSVVIHFVPCGHFYDFPVLALSAGMLGALLFQRLPAYLLLFAVACWTKETAILFTFAYCAIYIGRLPRSRFWLYLTAQLAIYASAQIALRLWYRNNPGSAVEVWYAEQLPWLARKAVLKIVFLGGLVFAISFNWSRKPLELRRALFMIAPHLVLFVYGARPGEARALYDTFPVLMLFLFRNSVEISNLLLPKAGPLAEG